MLGLGRSNAIGLGAKFPTVVLSDPQSSHFTQHKNLLGVPAFRTNHERGLSNCCSLKLCLPPVGFQGKQPKLRARHHTVGQ